MDRLEVQNKIEELFKQGLEKEELKKKMLEIYIEYAESQGIKMNPDEKRVDIILEGLVRKKDMNGKFYCPCRILEGNDEKDDPKVCPCLWHLDEIKNDGMCHCQLFARL